MAAPSKTSEVTSMKVWIVVALTVLTQLFFAGNIFGFASLQLLLESDGVFESACPADEPLCADRLQRFVLLFTICSVVICSMSFPAGLLADALGPVGTSLTGAAFEAAGLWFMGAAGKEDLAAFIAAATLCSLGSSFILFCGVPLAFIVPPSKMPLVMSLSSNAFDASAVIFLILYQLQSALSLPRFELFAVYAGVCVALHMALALAWMTGPLADLRTKQSEEAGAAPSESVHETPPLHGKSFSAQVRSFEFFFITGYFFVNVFLSNSYLGLNKSVLEKLGDAEEGYFYTSLFMALMPASCFCAPFISFVLRKFGFVGGYGVIASTCLGFLAIVMVPSLQLQVVAFMVYSCYRSTFFSTHFTFLGHTFGSRTSSSIQGFIALLGSFGQVFIYAFTSLVNAYGAGQLVLCYFLPCLAVVVPANFLLLWSLRKYLKLVPQGDCKATADATPMAADKEKTEASASVEEKKPAPTPEPVPEPAAAVMGAQSECEAEQPGTPQDARAATELSV